jgi:pimeloyl-ACP methyl ester carboxylesterase
MQPLSLDLPGRDIRLTGLYSAAPPGAPKVLLLHGFPEAAFIWAEVMQALAGQASLWAPNQRGFGGSSAPAGVPAYRARHLVGDLKALIDGQGGPFDLVVAHDWGGAVAWSLAAQHPQCLRRLLILNAPHPSEFLRSLRDDPVQQAASAYMNRLCEPDAAQRLAADDFAGLWHFLGADSAGAQPVWLTPALRDSYRDVWSRGLDTMLNWYRASPLKPPLGPDDAIHALVLPVDQQHIAVPTEVVWGEADSVLPPSLLRGLADWVPELQVTRVPGASHWIVHERPELVAQHIRGALGRVRVGQ